MTGKIEMKIKMNMNMELKLVFYSVGGAYVTVAVVNGGGYS